MRRDSENTAYFILDDSRRSDKRKGRLNDLDVDFIADRITEGCSYCGEINLRMTLDRIDNDLGHVKVNVVPACVRCNYFRRDMPYDLWLRFVPVLREAREDGSIEAWTSYGTHRRTEIGAASEVRTHDLLDGNETLFH